MPINREKKNPIETWPVILEKSYRRSLNVIINQMSVSEDYSEIWYPLRGELRCLTKLSVGKGCGSVGTPYLVCGSIKNTTLVLAHKLKTQLTLWPNNPTPRDLHTRSPPTWTPGDVCESICGCTV